MSIFSQISEKPWLESVDNIINMRPSNAFHVPTPIVGLRILLAAMTVLFVLTAISYADHMRLPNWRPLPDPFLLWLNTLILITSSVALQWARSAARHGDLGAVKKVFFAGGVLAIAFLLGQFLVSQQLVDMGYYASSNSANAFFYLITGLHALHLTGGMVAWGRTITKLLRGFSASQIALSVELCAIYWHFLLFVWLGLFTLMVST